MRSSTYVIGDVQGCFATLLRLLDAVELDLDRDRLWIAGDLVNRGPRSLETLRWARAHENTVRVVLGNHDLHLLARVAGASDAKKKDTLEEVLAAPDLDELIDWLRVQPLYFEEGSTSMVHAGIHPSWSVQDARRLAKEAESALASEQWREHIGACVGPAPAWDEALTGRERLAAVLAVLVRTRCVRDDGSLCDFSGPPAEAPAECHPWYTRRHVSWSDQLIAFGHWSSGGHHRGPGYVALDSGAVWGGKMTALRLGDGAVLQVAAADPAISKD